MLWSPFPMVSFLDNSSVIVPCLQIQGTHQACACPPRNLKTAARQLQSLIPAPEVDMSGSRSSARVEKGSAVKAEKGSEVKAEKGSEVKVEKGSAVKAEKGSAVKAEKGSAAKAEKDSAVKEEKGSVVEDKSMVVGFIDISDFKPGQKYPTPSPGNGDRVFYETLIEQNKNSEMAQDWCLAYGILSNQRAKALLAIVQKRKDTRGSPAPKKAPAPVKKDAKAGGRGRKRVIDDDDSDDVVGDTGMAMDNEWEGEGITL